MSTPVYYWPKPRPHTTVPGTLSRILKRAFCLSSPRGNRPHTLNRTNQSYLDGLVDADVDGAEELRALLIQHGEVEIWVE